MTTWTGCRNVRDLGGLATVDGGRIRAGALLRTDGHDRLTPEGVEAVRRLGLARIVDLRWAHECAARPSPFARDACYRHVPMLDEVLPYDAPAHTYAPMLDHQRHRVAAAFRVVAEAPAGTVVVHCHAGRDRTGVLVALLLSAAGVAAADVAADFALTEGCTPEPMRHTLAHLEARHGGVGAYLAGSGVGSGLVAAVRERLREQATAAPSPG